MLSKLQKIGVRSGEQTPLEYRTEMLKTLEGIHTSNPSVKRFVKKLCCSHEANYAIPSELVHLPSWHCAASRHLC